MISDKQQIDGGNEPGPTHSADSSTVSASPTSTGTLPASPVGATSHPAMRSIDRSGWNMGVKVPQATIDSIKQGGMGGAAKSYATADAVTREGINRLYPSIAKSSTVGSSPTATGKAPTAPVVGGSSMKPAGGYNSPTVTGKAPNSGNPTFPGLPTIPGLNKPIVPPVGASPNVSPAGGGFMQTPGYNAGQKPVQSTRGSLPGAAPTIAPNQFIPGISKLPESKPSGFSLPKIPGVK